MPEQIFEKLKKKILPQWKVCFLAALLFGLAAHAYKLTNWLPNWDSLVFRYDPQNMLGIGRWFLPVACAFGSFYDLPWLAGLTTVLLHGVGAVCICHMFGVQKKTTASLIGAVVATFPTVTSVMTYNYVADGYALSFVLAVLAAVCLTAKKPKFVASVLLIALSVGIYQAYVTVTVMLLLCYLIRETLQTQTKVKTVLLQCVRFLLAGALGMALYYLVLTVLLKVTGTALLAYQGFDSAASLSGIDILGSLYVIKHAFTDFFFDFSGGVSVWNILNCVIFVLTVLLYVYEAVKNKTSVVKLLLIAVFAFLLPIGASVLAFINSSVDYHNLMKMGFCVFDLFLLLQYEREDIRSAKWNAAVQWTVLAVATVLVCNQVVIANVSYHKLQIAYEKSYGTLIRIADRIEQTDGAEACDSILVFGYLPESEAYSADLSLDMTGVTDGFILRADDEIVGQSVLCSALNDYCGKNYRFLYGEEKDDLLDKTDIESFGSWPSKDSVFVTENVIIVKLGETE